MALVQINRSRLRTALGVFVSAVPSVLASCPMNPDLPGHETIKSLQDAMRSDFIQMLEGNASPPFVYHLCPGVTYRPDVEGAWIEPLADETSIICGYDGSSINSCIVEGGDLQVALVESEAEGYVRRKATFQGITFSGSKGWSVAAYDTSDTTVEFSDCHWKGISGQVGIQIVYKERPSGGSSPSSNSSSVNPTLINNTTVAMGRSGIIARATPRDAGGRHLQGSFLSGMNVVMRDCSMTDSWGLADQFFFGVSNAEGTLIMENVEVHGNRRNSTGTSIAVWNQGSAQIDRCLFHQNEFDVNVYNYQGEATIYLSTFEQNTGQSSIGITGGYTGISGNRFIENVFRGSGNIEAKSGYVDVSYCEFLGTSAQSDIITYGSGGSLFLEFSCFISGDYTLTPVFVGSDATLEDSTYIYADDLKPRSGQQCVEEPGVFVQAQLFEYNYTFCFDDDLTTPCIGTCDENPFDALSCDFKTPPTDAPTAAPTPVQQGVRSSPANSLSRKASLRNFGASMFMGWIIMLRMS